MGGGGAVVRSEAEDEDAVEEVPERVERRRDLREHQVHDVPHLRVLLRQEREQLLEEDLKRREEWIDGAECVTGEFDAWCGHEIPRSAKTI